jgi:hypothetical protein
MLERAFFDPGLQSVRECISGVDRILAPTGALLIAWSDLEKSFWPISDARIFYYGELKKRVNGIELSLAEFGMRNSAPLYISNLDALWKNNSLWSCIRKIVDESSVESCA